MCRSHLKFINWFFKENDSKILQSQMSSIAHWAKVLFHYSSKIRTMPKGTYKFNVCELINFFQLNRFLYSFSLHLMRTKNIFSTRYFRFSRSRSLKGPTTKFFQKL